MSASVEKDGTRPVVDGRAGAGCLAGGELVSEAFDAGARSAVRFGPEGSLLGLRCCSGTAGCCAGLADEPPFCGLAPAPFWAR